MIDDGSWGIALWIKLVVTLVNLIFNSILLFVFFDFLSTPDAPGFAENQFFAEAFIDECFTTNTFNSSTCFIYEISSLGIEDINCARFNDGTYVIKTSSSDCGTFEYVSSSANLQSPCKSGICCDDDIQATLCVDSKTVQYQDGPAIYNIDTVRCAADRTDTCYDTVRNNAVATFDFFVDSQILALPEAIYYIFIVSIILDYPFQLINYCRLYYGQMILDAPAALYNDLQACIIQDITVSAIFVIQTGGLLSTYEFGFAIVSVLDVATRLIVQKQLYDQRKYQKENAVFQSDL